MQMRNYCRYYEQVNISLDEHPFQFVQVNCLYAPFLLLFVLLSEGLLKLEKEWLVVLKS